MTRILILLTFLLLTFALVATPFAAMGFAFEAWGSWPLALLIGIALHFGTALTCNRITKGKWW
jgi:hypothetical protein